MKQRLMDILACPIDKAWPLKLTIKEESLENDIQIPEKNNETKVICRYYCNYKNYFLVEKDHETAKSFEEIKKNVTVEDCRKCFSHEIIAGEIICPNNKNEHRYEIKESIPIMLSPSQKKEIYGKK